MLFPIFILLLVLSPALLPMTIMLCHKIGDWRSERAGRPVDSLRSIRPAVGPVPAAA